MSARTTRVKGGQPVRRKAGLRRWRTHLRYLAVLAKKFRVTLGMAAALFGLAPLAFVLRYRTEDGEALRYGEALHHVYFLMYGEPSLAYVDDLWLELLNVLIPPLSIALVVDGIVRFTYLYFAKHRSDKEWIEVVSHSLQGHVVICGAGRVGYRVATQLLALGQELVVVEKREDGAFVQVLLDLGVPVLIDDIKSPQAMERTNMKAASALVCATDDDLANMNAALDARRYNPTIRVVMRLFDDDLVAKVRGAFEAEAVSSEAVAAPALALAALDPRVVHSFNVGGHLMVVSSFVAGRGLTGMTVDALRDRFGGLVLAQRQGEGPEQLHPDGSTRITEGLQLTVQLEYPDYLKLRDFTGEAKAPMARSA